METSASEFWLRFRLFGGCQILRPDRAVRLETAKTAALLAYLIRQKTPQTRHRLMGLLWPDLPESNARRNLRHALWNLRRECDCPGGAPAIVADAQTVAFEPRSDFWIDVEQFERAAAHADPASRASLLAEVVDLYQGDFLAGLYVDDAPEFEEWLLVERERLRAMALASLQDLVSSSVTWGEYDAGLAYARRLLELEPWLEEGHRQLMRLLTLSGRRSQALAQYETCRRILAQELSAEPTAETQALYQSIQAGDHEPDAAHPPPRDTLPVPATPFVGRDRELAGLAERIGDPACRLLTLLGPGGIGKTRLALQAAGARRDAFPDGVRFVALGGVGSPELLVPALADGIGLVFRAGANTRAQLIEHLAGRHLLLLLDNFENVLSAADLLAEVLQRAPHVKIIATSRERLNLEGEWLFPVEGLDYPRADQPWTGAGSYGAVQLFVQSARRVDLGFSLSEANAGPVVRFCRLVEGMPLAIELAAAWTRLLSCGEIVEQVQGGLDLLTTSLRDVPARHHSMRAVFEHSWRRLSAAERRVFAQLCIFRGGLGKEAAARVAGADLYMLAALVDRFFVRRRPNGRFELHELLRQYGLEKLSAGEAIELAERHRRYFVEFLARCQEGISVHVRKETVDEIAPEMENIRAAWDSAVECRSLEEIDQLQGYLYRVFEVRNGWQEGFETFERAIVDLGPHPQGQELSRILAWLLFRQGRQLERLARYDLARDKLQSSLALFREVDHRQDAAFPLYELGLVELMTGDYVLAERRLDESIAIMRAANGRYQLASALAAAGCVASQLGEYDEAVRRLREAQDIFAALESNEGTAFVHFYYGLVAQGRGDAQEATGSFQRGLDLFQGMGNAWGMAMCLQGLATVTMEGGDFDDARRLALEGLADGNRAGDAYATAMCLNCLGRIAHARGAHSESGTYHVEALRVAWQAGQLPRVLEALIGLTQVALNGAEREASGDWLTLVLSHPATAAEARVRATLLREGHTRERRQDPGGAQGDPKTPDLRRTVAQILSAAVYPSAKRVGDQGAIN